MNHNLTLFIPSKTCLMVLIQQFAATLLLLWSTEAKPQSDIDDDSDSILTWLCTTGPLRLPCYQFALKYLPITPQRADWGNDSGQWR